MLSKLGVLSAPNQVRSSVPDDHIVPSVSIHLAERRALGSKPSALTDGRIIPTEVKAVLSTLGNVLPRLRKCNVKEANPVRTIEV